MLAGPFPVLLKSTERSESRRFGVVGAASDVETNKTVVKSVWNIINNC